MILTKRARKKIEQLGFQCQDILAVIEHGETVQETQKQTTSNGAGGQRLLTYREQQSVTILKHVEQLFVRFQPENQLVIDVYSKKSP